MVLPSYSLESLPTRSTSVLFLFSLEKNERKERRVLEYSDAKTIDTFVYSHAPIHLIFTGALSTLSIYNIYTVRTVLTS